MTKSQAPLEVLITLPFGQKLLQTIQEVSPRLRVTVHPAKNVEEIPDELWARCEVLYTNRILPEPAIAPAIKWVQLHWAGVESLLGTSLLAKPGILVTTLSGAGASQSAEFALTMLLALGHHLPKLADHQKKADWPEDRWHKYAPRELRTSTVGIVGYGSIGRQIARLLREFGATVLATKHDVMHPSDSGYTPEGLGDPEGDFVHRLYPAQALKSMLKDCDYVIVAVPLTDDTRNLINADVLAACKPNAYLIDISRGGVIDHSALAKAINEEKIAGAALDVFPEEPLPAKNNLWKLPNVIITPHIAGVSAQYDTRAVTLFSENLSRYIADIPLYNLVDLKRGY